MNHTRVLISGGGIGGLALALTLHQIGVPFTVLESVRELRPLGVGINIQPNAVRELLDMGITTADFENIGASVEEWALVGQNGREIYSEPRGSKAGYKWPQYAVHRGQFHMFLAKTVLERCGASSIKLGHKVIGYENGSDGSVTARCKLASGEMVEEKGSLLVGADGIHSAVRAQMHPEQPPIHWGGAIMWRGTTLAKPIRTNCSFVGLGSHRHRMVIYPISKPDPETGRALVNWIAEVTVDDPSARENIGWFRQVGIDDFIQHFKDWTYDWLDVPAMLQDSDGCYENPMIDRDPVETWHDGSVVLMGDAAHAMYPTGSNGASQAVIDARIMGSLFLEHGVTRDALAAFDERLCGPVSKLVLLNRGLGPFGLLKLVNDRSGGRFENIDDIISPQERTDFMSGYKTAAGFAMDTLNAAPRTIAAHARVQLG